MSEERTRDRGSPAAASGNGSLTPDQRQSAVHALGRLASDQVQKRIPPPGLPERDPGFIRATPPRMWLLPSLSFRADLKGRPRMPADGPARLVRNPSGGTL